MKADIYQKTTNKHCACSSGVRVRLVLLSCSVMKDYNSTEWSRVAPFRSAVLNLGVATPLGGRSILCKGSRYFFPGDPVKVVLCISLNAQKKADMKG